MSGSTPLEPLLLLLAIFDGRRWDVRELKVGLGGRGGARGLLAEGAVAGALQKIEGEERAG